MTELQELDQEQKPRRWVRWAIGLAAVMAVAVVIAIIRGNLSPSSAAAAPAADTAVNQSISAAPAQAVAPAMVTLSSGKATNSDPAQPAETSASIATPAPPPTPLPTATPAPTQTPLPTVTSKPAPKPSAAATRAAAARSAAPASSQPAKSAPAKVVPTVAGEPLHFSFYVYAYCATRKIQNIQITITAQGGKPPYDYYNDTQLLAQATDGSVRYTQDAPAGNPVPYQIIIVDSTGQKYSEAFFYKTHLHCGF